MIIEQIFSLPGVLTLSLRFSPLKSLTFVSSCSAEIKFSFCSSSISALLFAKFFARVLLYGGRVSLTIGFLVVIVETLLGVVLGGLAGYFGGKVDNAIMRVTDILYCIPTLPIMLIFSAVFDSFEITSIIRLYYMMGILTLIGWAGIERNTNAGRNPEIGEFVQIKRVLRSLYHCAPGSRSRCREPQSRRPHRRR